jgi:hypothetical protein
MNPKRKPLALSLLIVWLICIVLEIEPFEFTASLGPYIEIVEWGCFGCFLFFCLRKKQKESTK